MQILLSTVTAHNGGELGLLLSPTVFWLSGFLMVIMKTPHNFGFAVSHLIWCFMMAVPSCVLVFTGVPIAPPKQIITQWFARCCSGVMVCAMVVSASLVLGLHSPLNQSPRECNGGQLTIGSFNVHLGLSRVAEPNLVAIADEIGSASGGPDVLALQVWSAEGFFPSSFRYLCCFLLGD